MRLWDEEPRPPACARPVWAALLAAALVCAVLAAALGGCPRMRALAGSAPDSSHRAYATAAPQAVAADTRQPAGTRCHGAKTVAAPAPAPRAQVRLPHGSHPGAPASAPLPSPPPPSSRRPPDGCPEPPLRV
ncbi:hypothetical protein [Streptomyces sp. NPDC048106]|uniref:hypothetical protein n=1 Tax=Streptomyces sp. NPDC048106 TaxID=3155750 RepID=UPI003454A5BB